MTRRVGLVAVALAVSIAVDLATGAAVPGRMAVVALGAAFVLVLGGKWLASVGLQRPVGSRPGERGDPADDQAPAHGEVTGRG